MVGIGKWHVMDFFYLLKMIMAVLNKIYKVYICSFDHGLDVRGEEEGF